MAIPFSMTLCTDAADWSGASLLPPTSVLGGSLSDLEVTAPMPEFAVLLASAPVKEATAAVPSDEPGEAAPRADAAGRLIAATAPVLEPFAGGLACCGGETFSDAGSPLPVGSLRLAIAAPVPSLHHRPTDLSARLEQPVCLEGDDAPTDDAIETPPAERCRLAECVASFVRDDATPPQSTDAPAGRDEPEAVDSIDLAASWALPPLAGFVVFDMIASATPATTDATASPVTVAAASPELFSMQPALETPQNRSAMTAPPSGASSTEPAMPDQPSPPTNPSLAPDRLGDEAPNRTAAPARLPTPDVVQETDRRRPEPVAPLRRTPVAAEVAAPAATQAIVATSEFALPPTRANRAAGAPHSAFNAPQTWNSHGLLTPQAAEFTTALPIETPPAAPEPLARRPAPESRPANRTMQEILTDVSGVSSAAPDSISVEDPPRPVAAPSLRGKQAVSSPAIEPPVARPDLTGSSDPGLPSQGRSLSAERRPAASDQPSLAPLDESAAAAAPAMRQVRPASERPVNSDPSPQAGAPGPPQSLSAATAIAAPDVPTFDAPPLEHRADRDAARTSGRLPDWRAPEAQLIHAAIARMQIVRRLGESEFDLRLTPPELGTLRVSLRQTREGLNVQVAADDPATQSLLESSRQEIAQALQRDQPGGVKLSLQTHAEGDRPPPEPALWEDRPGAARRPTGSAPHTRSNSRLSFLA